jgi:predicted O-methyltransferase YrrM
MAPQTSSVSSVRELLADPPLVHEWMSTGGLMTHGLLPEALAFIESTVSPGQRTLETGSGLSTIAFALRGTHHTCIVPDAAETERIRSYCEGHGIDTSNVTFHVSPSERVLPALDLEPLDLVLIDGSHSFPQVFIDWYYVQDALRVGGVLVVDDVHIWTGKVLRDFLAAEPEWALTERWAGRTVAFRKVADVNTSKDWSDQPFVWRRTRPETLGRVKMLGGLLRSGDLSEIGRRVRALAASRSSRGGTR